MRKLVLAALAAALIAPVGTRAQGFGYGGAMSASQGAPGTSPWLSALYIGAAPNSITNPAFWQMVPGTAYGGQMGVSATANAGGVAAFSRLPSSAASTNTTQAKTSAGRVLKIVACNTSTTSARIKFYNVASAPTVGTTTVLFTRPIPAAAATGGLACATYDWADIGAYFSTGIAWALTAGAADNDTTAVAAGAITDVSVEYQ